MSSVDLLDDLIRSVLNDPLPDERPPGWGDVLRRLPAPRPRVRRRLLLVAAILALVVVPPAVAFHRELSDWILGKPAPERVARAFEGWNLLAQDERNRAYGRRLFATRVSEVDVSKAQGVVALDTPDGQVSLWDVPQRGGGRCWLFVAGDVATSRRALGACDHAAALPEALNQLGWVGLAELPDVLLVHARVRDGLTVELRFPDGRTQPMEVAGGHAVAAIPLDTPSVVLVAEDASGKVVQVAPLSLPPPDRRVCPGMCSGETSRSGGGGSISQFGAISAGNP